MQVSFVTNLEYRIDAQILCSPTTNGWIKSFPESIQDAVSKNDLNQLKLQYKMRRKQFMTNETEKENVFSKLHLYAVTPILVY